MQSVNSKHKHCRDVVLQTEFPQNYDKFMEGLMWRCEAGSGGGRAVDMIEIQLRAALMQAVSSFFASNFELLRVILSGKIYVE